MNKSLRYIAILAILPLFTVGLTANYFEDANALKSKGVRTSKYSSATNVCGLQLCSEFPGGKDAWEAQQSSSSTVDSAPIEESDETKSINESDLGSVLRLSRANVPATIPLHQGYYNGEYVYFIITDSSDKTHAEIITKNQGWKVELAPLLVNAPESALSKTFMFVNGVEGDGVHGFQGEVFTSTPDQPETYSALTSHVHVTWNDGQQPRILNSEEMVMTAAEMVKLH